MRLSSNSSSRHYSKHTDILMYTAKVSVFIGSEWAMKRILNPQFDDCRVRSISPVLLLLFQISHICYFDEIGFPIGP